ncbi:MAG: hypothetical protein WD354_04375 [Acidimicrobiia bacterium]
MPIVIGPHEGVQLPGDFEVVVKVRSEDTAGVMAVLEETVPSRRLVSPHTHENDVWVYVLTGEVGILVGDQVQEAGRVLGAQTPQRRARYVERRLGSSAHHRGADAGRDRALV